MTIAASASSTVLGLIPYSRAGNLVGGLLMALSMTLFVMNDTIMSSLQQADNPLGVATLPLPSIIAVRGTLVAGFLLIIVLATRQLLAPRAVANPWNLARAGVEATITFLFLSSLPFLPFAVAQTIISSNPIFLVFLGIFLFGERIGWRRWTAIGIGLVGIGCAALALDPGDFDSGNFRLWAIFGCLGAAILVAFRDVFTRYVGEAVPPVTIAFTSAVAVMIYGWVFSLGSWQTPDAQQAIWLFASALLVMGAYLSAVFAVRLGIFAVVGPLRFVSLAVAFIFSLLVFREGFSLLGFAGAALIVGSAIWIVLRQAKLDAEKAAT